MQGDGKSRWLISVDTAECDAHQCTVVGLMECHELESAPEPKDIPATPAR